MRAVFTAIVLAALAAGCQRPSVPTELYFSGQPVSHWLEALKSPDPKARKKAVDVLGNVGPGDPVVLPALIGAMKDEDPQVRDAAVLAVSKMGPAGAAAEPALREAARDPNPAVRGHAVAALGRISGRS
jgi:HEAT repeat protein